MGLVQPTLDQLRDVAAMLRIPLKDQGAVGPWHLNASQERVGALLCDGESIIVLKSRQEGITSLCLLWLLLLAVLNPGQRFAVVLQDQAKAIGKLDTLKQWLGQIGYPLNVSQAQRLRLDGGAEIHALSAGAGEAEGEETAANRSEAYAAALLSEAAYYRNDKALPAIKAAVGRGPIVIESTASGPEGFFAQLWEAARTTFAKVFLGIEQSARCQADPAAITDETWKGMQAEHGFTSREHAAWWHRELYDVGGDVLSMLREYPVRPSDPFRVSDSMWVRTRPEVLAPLSVTDTGAEVYETRHRLAPHEARYMLTVDPSAGVGADWCVAWVLNRATGEVCATVSSNTEPADVFAPRVAELWRTYKPDVCLVEENGVGEAHVIEYRRLGIPVTTVWADEASKYQHLLLAKRWVEERKAVPVLLVEEAKDLRVKLQRLGKYQWIGRKDGLVALGQGLEWIRLSPWAPPKPLREDNYYDQLERLKRGQSTYYGTPG